MIDDNPIEEDESSGSESGDDKTGGTKRKRDDDDDELDDRLSDDDFDLLEENLGIKVKVNLSLICKKSAQRIDGNLYSYLYSERKHLLELNGLLMMILMLREQDQVMKETLLLMSSLKASLTT